ncbi:GNAT family N-acetyltransferase [Paraferrimonas sedimenticola]|uniref:N-acetyltransferase n=1 Tax=Paraferrimonas sedimenticola TaxID=375674 RepID=A0AA37VSQ5_9GAMM|nr:GNAT family N-acetyltransferase [Paraferrimonas sedimenticola]GLP94856.1 N-acetyltransferase [Paraferrimonas sedimenticola]
MSAQLQIIPIERDYDPLMAAIIRQVGHEFGAVGEGFGPGDAEVDALSQHYHPEQKSQYWVALVDGELVGGGGIGALAERPQVAELRKVFLLPESRGQGIGRKLTECALDFAKAQGYQGCYLDTLNNMTAAIALYHRLGFERLKGPMASLHNRCDVWMYKDFSRD